MLLSRNKCKIEGVQLKESTRFFNYYCRFHLTNDLDYLYHLNQ